MLSAEDVEDAVAHLASGCAGEGLIHPLSAASTLWAITGGVRANMLGHATKVLPASTPEQAQRATKMLRRAGRFLTME